MLPTNCDLHFVDAFGREHVARAVTADGDGWQLHASIHGAAFAARCSDWQSVERTLVLLRLHGHEHRLDILPNGLPDRPATRDQQ